MSLLEVKERLSAVKCIQRNKVSPLIKHLAYRPTFNIDVYRESLLHRFVELSEGSLSLVETKNYISSVVCARAAQETFAVIAYISFKLEEFESTKDLAVLFDTMRQLSIGWRCEKQFPEMINVLTCIDHVSKKLDPEFRRHYDMLSESAHPNYSGVLGTYSTPNHKSKEVRIGLRTKEGDRLKTLVETTIQICIVLFEHIQSEFEERMNAALDICIEFHREGKLIDIFYNET